jgi:hypothetical protein
MELKHVGSDRVNAQFDPAAIWQHRELSRLSDDLKLLDSGLDSDSYVLPLSRN